MRLQYEARSRQRRQAEQPTGVRCSEIFEGWDTDYRADKVVKNVSDFALEWLAKLAKRDF
jgi:hypothetical protein